MAAQLAGEGGGAFGPVAAVVRALGDRFAASAELELQQRALEILNALDAVADEPDVLGDVLPYDASLEDPLDGVVTTGADGARNADDALGSVQETPSTSLQHDFVRVDANDVCVQISRTRAEMINGPRRSRID